MTRANFSGFHARPVATILLAVLVVAVFWPTARNSFISLDDPAYLTANPVVQEGLTQRGVAWAFTSFGYVGNWHPLTWLSHLLDVQLFGLDAGKHHLVGLLLHLGSVLLLFLILNRATGAVWRSAFAAALFGVHPLHVESVAWAAERKDILSGFFFMLTLLAYLSHVRKPAATRYLGVVLLFTLGLMAKPMLVTIPFLLLLLDYWPLGRIGWGSSPSAVPRGAILLEKVPLLILATASSVVTYLAQASGGIFEHDTCPPGFHLHNAVVSYSRYLAKTIYPSGLAVFYPLPQGWWPLWMLAGSAVLLAGFSTLAVGQAGRRPFLTVGWFWFVGMMVPVIGLLQVGSQSMADRYSYLPLIGIFVAFSWGAAEIIRRRRSLAPMLVMSAVVILFILGGVSRVQLGYWKDSLTIFEHALAVTRGNWMAELNVGALLMERGSQDEAMEHFRRALEIRPSSEEAHNNLGVVLAEKGESAAAIEQYREALRIKPDHAEAHYNLGVELANLGHHDEAAASFQRAIAIRPDYAKAWLWMGIIQERRGRWADAVGAYREALRSDPGWNDARLRLDEAMRMTESQHSFQLQHDPREQPGGKQGKQ